MFVSRLTALEKYEEFLLRVKAEKTANNFTALDAVSKYKVIITFKLSFSGNV